jgi:hypothetical protein
MNKMLLVILIAILGQVAAKPQDVNRDSIAIYFPAGVSRIVPEFRTNNENLIQLISTLTNPAKTIDGVAISATASPDGRSDLNANLADARYVAIYEYIRRNTNLPDSLITKAATGIAWTQLRQMVAENPDAPCRDEIIRIIDNVPVWVFDANGRIIDSRKKQLMDLNGGECYRWMLSNLFPDLRSSMGVMLYSHINAAPVAETTNNQDSSKTIQLAQNTSLDDNVGHGDAIEANQHTQANAVILDEEELHGRNPLYRFAAKTNLVYDAALMPSVELEWRINKHWSAAVEFDCAWWSRKETHRYYQIAMVVPEGRYWFHTSGPWRGMYAGIFVAGGKYDLENGGTGYKGQGAMAGVSYGYMWQISRRFSLEAAIGAGILRTRYEEYIPVENEYIYQRKKDYTFVGPLKLKFAIVWRFNDISKKGGRAK